MKIYFSTYKLVLALRNYWGKRQIVKVIDVMKNVLVSFDKSFRVFILHVCVLEDVLPTLA